MKDILLNQAVVVVDDPEVAAVLTDIKQWNVLSAFMLQERTLSDAARYLKMKLPTLTYRVQRLLHLGILELARTEARRGSPVKYYRAVSRHFFVPFQVTPQATLETLLHSSHHWFDERVK